MRLLCNVPNGKDATSFYRAVGPLSTLKNVRIKFGEEYDWSIISMCDVLFMQRPYNERHLNIIRLAKAQRKPVWIDYDDDLFSVTSDNPAHEVYANEDTQQKLEDIIQLADVITVSTEYLRISLQNRVNKKIVVINNMHNDIIFERPHIAPKNVISWRGSNTHQKDLSTVAPEIVEINKKYNNWEWIFFGYNPWFVTDYMVNTSIGSKTDIIDYFHMFASSRPAIHIVPLYNSPFNRSKSNIAALEAIWAGAVVIAPDWDEFKIPGVLNYRSNDHFKELLEWAINNKKEHKAINDAGWKHIKDNLMLSKNTNKRMEILYGLGNFN